MTNHHDRHREQVVIAVRHGIHQEVHNNPCYKSRADSGERTASDVIARQADDDTSREVRRCNHSGAMRPLGRMPRATPIPKRAPMPASAQLTTGVMGVSRLSTANGIARAKPTQPPTSAPRRSAEGSQPMAFSSDVPAATPAIPPIPAPIKSPVRPAAPPTIEPTTAPNPAVSQVTMRMRNAGMR